jgi:hypothetical protein
MSYVGVRNGRRELDLDRDDPVIGPLDDQIDLMSTGACPEMPNRRFGRLSKDPDAEGHQGFEELPEQNPVTNFGRDLNGPVQKRA